VVLFSQYHCIHCHGPTPLLHSPRTVLKHRHQLTLAGSSFACPRRQIPAWISLVFFCLATAQDPVRGAVESLPCRLVNPSDDPCPGHLLLAPPVAVRPSDPRSVWPAARLNSHRFALAESRRTTQSALRNITKRRPRERGWLGTDSSFRLIILLVFLPRSCSFDASIGLAPSALPTLLTEARFPRLDSVLLSTLRW